MKIKKSLKKIKNIKISDYSPVKKDRNGQILICGDRPVVCAQYLLVILALWGIFIGLFFGLLYGYMDRAKEMRGTK